MAGEARAPTQRRPWWRSAWVMAVALIVVLIGVLVISLAAGDGDDSPDSGGSRSSAQGGGAAGSAATFGEEAGPADRAAAGRAVGDFLHAFVDEDGATACSLLSSSAKENLAVLTSQIAKSQACPEQLDALRAQFPAKRLPQPGRIEVTDLRIVDDGGLVLYRDREGEQIAFPVVRENDAWKVAVIVGQRVG